MVMDATGVQVELKVTGGDGSVNAAGPLAVFWDIDGTLLSSDGAGRWAMETAFCELFGVTRALQDLELAGRTDEAILLDAARRARVVLSEEDRVTFREHYARLLVDALGSRIRRPRALPGVTKMLSTLSGDRRFICGLLTGNWEHSASIKLAAVGLDTQFRFGAFAGDGATREDLLPIALERAHRTRGWVVPARRAVIIGDTPRDVNVAKKHGACSIAVATGPHGAEELKAAGPDLVVVDLTDPAAMAKLVEWHDSR